MTLDNAESTRTPRPSGEADNGADTDHDDGLLDSLGKAVAAPVEGAAEPDELSIDPERRTASRG